MGVHRHPTTHEKRKPVESQPIPATPPKLVIFDCDGVLVDSEPFVKRALLQVLASYGLNLRLEEAETYFKGLQNDDVKRVVEERWGVFLPDDFSEVLEAAEWSAVEQGMRAVDGVELAVRSVVDSGLATCVASNGSPESMEHRLKLAGLLQWFEGRLFSGWTVPRAKPYPDVFLHAAATMGYQPSECAVIEDSPAGIQAGVAAGMRVLAYTGGSDDAAAVLEGVEIFKSMSSLSELLGL